MNRMRITIPSALAVACLLLAGCGHKLGYRHFAGPILPAPDPDSSESLVVRDDHSITFVQGRLEVSLLPMTVDVLNRQLGGISETPEGFHEPNPYGAPTNPYTYGDWKPGWEDERPTRFSVFLLKVKNYAYPKVWLDPYAIQIVAPNGRQYPAYSRLALDDYYASYALGYAGNTYNAFRERRDLLRRTMYPEDEMVFSGQEKEGYVVFAPLADDVESFQVVISDLVLRFDYRDEPVEVIDVRYPFTREVYLAKHVRSPAP